MRNGECGVRNDGRRFEILTTSALHCNWQSPYVDCYKGLHDVLRWGGIVWAHERGLQDFHGVTVGDCSVGRKG